MVDTFPIVPASSRMLWIIAVLVGALFVGIFAMLLLSARGASASRFELSDEGLRIRGDVYGRQIPRSALRGGAARIVDLRTERALAPRTRTMGTAIPGYQAGWFRLNNGAKALLYLTDHTQAVYVPTTAGYDLLLSPRDPGGFVLKLRALAPQS